MWARFAITLAVAGILSACATGPSYRDQMAATKPPPEGSARIAMYRPWAFMYGGRSPTVEINGLKACDIPNGSAFIKDVPPGQITIASSIWDAPGTSRLTFKATAGQTYHVRFSLDGGKMAAAAVGGMVGMWAAEAVAERGGPFAIDFIDPNAFAAELAEAKVTSCN